MSAEMSEEVYDAATHLFKTLDHMEDKLNQFVFLTASYGK
jgi:glutathionyl-hydroquinone reductase